jgi:hypothetical protein
MAVEGRLSGNRPIKLKSGQAGMTLSMHLWYLQIHCGLRCARRIFGPAVSSHDQRCRHALRPCPLRRPIEAILLLPSSAKPAVGKVSLRANDP